MNSITDAQLADYVQASIGSFHEKRLEALKTLRLDDLLRRKNPYLFRSKNVSTAFDLIASLLDAHLSSQEETLFGAFLEGLALHVAEAVHGGRKSSAAGIDLEFEKEEVRYIVSIKSGPNWGNSSQVARMRENFKNAARLIRQGDPGRHVVAVNGCCYGRDGRPDKGDYFKYCGQEFWRFVSGESDFYARMIEPLGHRAKRRSDDFAARRRTTVELLSSEFSAKFCDGEDAINWERFVSFSSARKHP